MNREMNRSMPRCGITFLLLFCTVSAIAADETAASLIGVWGAERIFAPAASFQVSIAAEGDQFFAYAQGLRTEVALAENIATFRFPRDQGAFRGQVPTSGQPLRGHWISAPGPVAYSPYASPLALQPVADGRWLGEVTPLLQTFSLYIAVQRDEEGEIRAFLRNPERNQGVYTRLHSVTRDGEDVRFLGSNGETALAGRYDEESDTLTVFMPWRGGSYDLSRRERDNASGFYPHPDTSPYRYRQPLPTGDGWPLATPEEVGLDRARLTALVQHIQDTPVTSLRSPSIHSLLVARRGKLVLDEYFHGHSADRTHDLRSASKSVTGIMTGLAIEKTTGLSTATAVYPLFPEHSAGTDDGRKALTVDHLLSMRGGFACDDNDENSPGNEDRMHNQQEQPDWQAFTLNLPMAAAPGTTAVYCSGAINLLGGVISRATGMWLPDFFATHLAEPLQIHRYYMNLDPVLKGYAGGGLQLRPRDFLKLGQVMAGGGRWKDQVILSPEWVERSFAAHAAVYQAGDYGYTWWRSVMQHDGQDVMAFSATGNGGQLLVVIPTLDLVVGFNGGNYSDFRTWIAWRDQLIPEYVLDAISDSQTPAGRL